MNFDAFVAAAWRDHAEHAEEVAERLASAGPLIETAQQFGPIVQLVCHVYGEHLGWWQQGASLLAALRELPGFDGNTLAQRSLARGIAMLHYGSGDDSALAPLAADDRVWALATAASAFGGRGAIVEAASAFRAALHEANAGLPAGSPAIRALAVSGNNLAVTLEQKTDRSADETAAMLMAAEAGLQYWQQAGGWLETERAHYRLARSCLQAGKVAAAVANAQQCLSICTANAAAPFELVFAHAVLAMAYRADGDAEGYAAQRQLALQALELVADDDKQWCAADLAELAAPAD